MSVATSGTHDTEPVAVWWESATEDERRTISDLPSIHRLSGGTALLHAAFDATVRDLLLEALFGSPSHLLLLPVQDAFGWHDRINEPATINDQNWTFRLPWPVDVLDEIPEACERKQTLAVWAKRHGR